MSDIGPVLQEFPYRPRWRVIAIVTGFFAACGLALTYQAQSGKVLAGIVAVGAWGFAILGLVAGVARVVLRQRIVVGRDAITVPFGRWSRQEAVIPLSSLSHLELQVASGQKSLKVHYEGGSFVVVASMLPADVDFERIRVYLATGEWAPAQASDAATPDPKDRELREIDRQMRASTPALASPWALLALKIGALLSFCGGPLYVTDLLKPMLGNPGAFVAGFSPVALMVFGVFSLVEDKPSALSRVVASAGGVASLVVMVESVVAAVRVMGGEERADAGLILVGCVVSIAGALGYFWLLGRWRQRAG
jgi:hypothetical protein